MFRNLIKITFNILFILFAFILDIYAETNTITPVHCFNYLTTQNGFENNTIWTIHQDEIGFIWFGTKEGLYKYDGVKLRLIKKNFGDNKSNVTAISETKSNNTLWLIVDKKLFALDLLTEKISEVKQTCNQNILCIYTDYEDRLWISSQDNGIQTLDSKTKIIFNKNNFADINNIIHIGQSSESSYYFLTKNNGIITHNTATGKRDNFSDNRIKPTTCLIDSKKRIWLGTWNGLFMWSKHQQKFKKINLENINKKIFAIHKIVEKSPHELYIATDRGLFIYNTDNSNITHYKADILSYGHLNNNYINDILIDSEKTLWIATYFGGVNYITESNKKLMSYDYINNKMEGHVVSSFAEDKDGNLWITTDDGGISFYNKTSKKTTNYNPLKSPNPYIDFFNVHAIVIDDYNLYIGMSSVGMNIINLKTRKIRKVSTEGEDGYKLSGMSITKMHKIDSTKIAIGTMKGLDMYDINSGKIEHIHEIPDKEIMHIITDNEGYLWVVGIEFGAFKRNKEGKWINICKNNENLTNLPISKIAVDKENIYFGTKYQGLICLNQVTNSLSEILSEELTQTIINCIIPIGDILWIGTTNGLFAYNLSTKKYKHFTEKQGLKAKCINMGTLTKDGTIFIGTTNGLNGFNPNELVYDYGVKNQKTVFTNLEVNHEDFNKHKGNTEEEKIITYTNTIKLKHNQSDITLEFAHLSYSNLNNRIYRYNLSPIDKEWYTTKSNILNFKKLPPNEYILTVQSKNNDGNWEEKGCSLKIIILPPWWATWQMYSLYILLIISFITYSLFQFKKKHEKNIKEINLKKKEELYQSKMEFFNNIIHDIRTPLTLIISPLEELMSRNNTDSFREELKMMSRNGKRLLNYVNQLMDFQKINNSNNIPVLTEPISIMKELSNIKYDFQNLAESKFIAINIITDESITLDCYIDGNKNLFDKIFTNLISNAIKFTKDQINIRISQKDEYYLVAIEDNGIGISKDFQDRIFEPFFQIKNDLTSDYIGTGIGLAIVKDAVEKIGGTLYLNSEIGVGTTFVISLPIAQSTKIEDTTSNKPDVEIPEEKSEEYIKINNTAKSKWKIAIAEDNEDMRNFIISVLSPLYKVYTYANGQDLLDDVENIGFDLIVSDIMMPKLNGYELCKTIKDNTHSCHIPLILLTAKIMETDEIEGLEYGADAYIKKPFSKGVFLAHIKNLILNHEKRTSMYKHDPNINIGKLIKDKRDKEFVENLNKIIEKNIQNTELSAQMVASELCICRALFFSKIKGVLGVSFTNYVRIIRLKKAIELMKSDELSMLEISKEVGFSSLSYFSKSFKQQYGINPSEYKRQ